jgi:hypothetical protein
MKPLAQVVSGAEYIDGFSYFHKIRPIYIMEIHTRLKHPQVVMVSDGDSVSHIPAIWTDASAASYVGGQRIDSAPSEIHFPALKGWHIYTTSTVGRYTIAVIFHKP